MTDHRSTLNAILQGLTAVGVSLLLGACSRPASGLQMNPGPAKNAPTQAEVSASVQEALAQRTAPNDLCPITGDAADPKFSVAHRGRTIAFCCEHCFREFRESDDAGKAAIAAKLDPPR